MLTQPEILLIGIIIGLFALIFFTKFKIELIALIVMVSLYIIGLLTPEEALSGFSSSVVITLLGLFILTHALEVTGVVQWIANQLNRIGSGSEIKLLTLFMFAGAMMSLVMNNVAAGAVLLPAAVQVARISNVSISKLLMPMSFGTLVGGMATYLTTANIIMSELLISRGLDGLTMGSFIPVGMMIVVAGLIYMLLIGRHLLPTRESGTNNTQWENDDLPSTYSLENREWRLRIQSNSRLAGKTLGDSDVGNQLGITIVTIWRATGEQINSPNSSDMLMANDICLFIGREERITKLQAWGTTLLNDETDPDHTNELPGEPVEIIIPPRSEAVGKTLQELQFHTRHGLRAIALWRGNRSFRTDVGQRSLEVGDALLVLQDSQESAKRITTLADTRDYIVPASGYAAQSHRTDKAPMAFAILNVVLLIAILNVFSLPLAMMTGAVAMVVTGCLNMEEFYEAIEWRVIFLVAGMLPLSIAISDSGLADRLGSLVTTLLSDSNPLVLVGGMVVLTMLVVQIIGGQIAGLLIGPIAINTALQVGINPQAMAVAVAMACSMAFLTPIAHPVNILMMTPGNYEFGDFAKVGIGMTIVTLLTMLLGLHLIWGVG